MSIIIYLYFINEFRKLHVQVMFDQNLRLVHAEVHLVCMQSIYY